MAYSDKAKEIRRCVHVHADGRRCRAYAVWGDVQRLCNIHGGRRHRGPMRTSEQRLIAKDVEWITGVEFLNPHAKAIPCRSEAYAWPHRPGGGLCRWPDPPMYQRTTPAGTHRPGRPRLPRAAAKSGVLTAKQARSLFRK